MFLPLDGNLLWQSNYPLLMAVFTDIPKASLITIDTVQMSEGLNLNLVLSNLCHSERLSSALLKKALYLVPSWQSQNCMKPEHTPMQLF